MLSRTEAQMVQSRRFRRYAQVKRALLELYRGRAQGATVVDLYPAIIQWAQNDG